MISQEKDLDGIFIETKGAETYLSALGDASVGMKASFASNDDSTIFISVMLLKLCERDH